MSGFDAPPVLTLPHAEAALVRAEYSAAQTILEYGSGGTTVFAAGLSGRRVYSVEADAAWAKKMADWFNINPPQGHVILHLADIGPTKDWSHPVDNRAFAQWPGYAISVWDRPDFTHPDVVLVDGRFRLACALTTLFRITRPVTVLIDDYIDRQGYKRIETLVGPPEMIGRIARFQISPQTMPPEHMHWIIPASSSPS